VGKYPSQVGLFSAEELAKIQGEMEERLSRKLKVASAREEALSGFLAMRPLEAATRRQVEIFIRVMVINEEAGAVRIGHGSEHAAKLFRLLDAASELLEEFLRLEAQG
jgi:hypothetical protein